MLKESGRVVAVDVDGLWVETLKTSTCAKCVAKAGCGQNLAAKLMPTSNMTLIKAFFQKENDSNSDAMPGEAIEVERPAQECDRWKVGDTAIIGVAENALLAAAFFAYGVPLILMVIGLMLSQVLPPLVSSSDLQAALGALIGILVGGLVVRYWSKHRKDDGFFHAHVLSQAIVTDTSIAADAFGNHAPE